uniref:THAP-type domain-containing protein n=1 Tax=Schizaphis graminum TaxID=13262 RepID=A0A2S2NEK3_SCHGA
MNCRFPLKDPNKLQLWIDAVKRKGFNPNNSSRVCNDHFLRSDFIPRPGGSYKLMLKGESVPSLLMSGSLEPPKKICNIETIYETPLQSTSMTITPNFNPTILKSQESIESVAIDLSVTSTPPNVSLTPIKTPHSISPLLKTPSKCIPHSSTLVTPARRLNFPKSPITHSTPTKTKLKKKLKLLQQRVRRQRLKINSLQQLLKSLKQKGLLNSDDGEVISSKFEGLSQEIFMNQLKNCKRHAKGHRYSAEIKKFALTLHYYSPKAYQYCRLVKLQFSYTNFSQKYTKMCLHGLTYFLIVLKL